MARGRVAILAGTLAVFSVCRESRPMLLPWGAGAYAPGWRRGARGAPSYGWVAKEEHKDRR